MKLLNDYYSYPPNPFNKHGPYCVYLFVLPDRMYYVGSTGGDLCERWRKGYNKNLTKAINDMGGVENVPKYILRSGLSRTEAAFFERMFAIIYHSYWPNGYNKAKCGMGERVLQIDKETSEVIQVWPSMTRAAKELKISQGDISMTVHGKRKSAGGFYWCYADSLISATIAQEGGEAY